MFESPPMGKQENPRQKRNNGVKIKLQEFHQSFRKFLDKLAKCHKSTEAHILCKKGTNNFRCINMSIP